MPDEQTPGPAPQPATALPPQDPFHVLAYEPLMTRIKAAQLKPLFTGLLAALGIMALGNIVMFALVQQAQQETVDFATKVAANSDDNGEFQGATDSSGNRMATFGPLADLIDSIKEKERRRDTLLAQRPEYAGNLPVANAPDWRAVAAQQLRAYEDQVDAQIAMLGESAGIASAESIAPSSLDAPAAAPSFAAPLPAPSSALAKPAPVKQAVKQAAKQTPAKRGNSQTAAAKRASDSNYARELTAALNRAARDQAPVAAGSIGSATMPAPPAPTAPIADVATISTATPIQTAPVAPEAVTPASDELGQ